MGRFFLPPTELVAPPRARLEPFHRRRPTTLPWTTYRRGVTVEVAGITYQGGRWHGPLTAQQITDLTAAGYGARLVEAMSDTDLPADID